MSRRPVTSHSCMVTESPSLMERLASRQLLAEGASERHREHPGQRSAGRPMATRPANAPRTRPELFAGALHLVQDAPPVRQAAVCRPRSALRPRPLRTSKLWRSSTSSRRTCRDSAGCATCSATAARVKLPSSATRTKYSSCLRSMAGVLADPSDHSYVFLIYLLAGQCIFSRRSRSSPQWPVFHAFQHPHVLLRFKAFPPWPRARCWPNSWPLMGRALRQESDRHRIGRRR